MSGGRYERLEQIGWWDRERVSRARALVAGAGALGNELIKNLLLVGWGTIVVGDFDQVEEGNLSRSILFHDDDVGSPKTAAITRNAALVNADTRVIGLDGDIRLTISSGMLARMDVVFGCLDNLAGRVALGQLAGQAGCLMIDGGLTTWEGTVRLYRPPDGPCYACGLTQADLRELTLRRSCLAYAARSEQAGGVPTTPTVASVTAALMAQQGLRWIHADLHDQEIPIGREIRLDLAHDRFWNVAIPQADSCVLHPHAVALAEAPILSWEQSWTNSINAVQAELGEHSVEFHLPLQVLTRWSCLDCGAESSLPRVHIGDQAIACTRCGNTAIPELSNLILGGEPWAEYSPRDMGFPPWTWFIAQAGGIERIYEIGGAPPELAALNQGCRS